MGTEPDDAPSTEGRESVSAAGTPGPVGTFLLLLFAVVCMGVPAGALVWGTWWTAGTQYEMAMDSNRRGASILFGALDAGSPRTADEVRAITERYGDIQAFQAGADRATFEVRFTSLYVTTRETDGWARACFEFVWAYAGAGDSSYTEKECGS